jgi:uncharacterized secreted protein with C-terminal beta-propeller domain
METKTLVGLTLSVLLAGTSTFGLVGCSGDSGSTKNQDNAVEEPKNESKAGLKKATNCEELEELLKAEAIAKFNKEIDEKIAAVNNGGQEPNPQGGYGGDGGGNWGTGGATGGWGGGPPWGGTAGGATGGWGGGPPGGGTAGGGVGGSGGGSGGSGPGPVPGGDPNQGATSHSTTNTQVANVDEADIVKTDGTYLYYLHGTSFSVVKAWPAPELSMASALTIEGTPTEMFVKDGHVVVYSLVQNSDVYAKTGSTPPKPAQNSTGFHQPNGLTKATVIVLENAVPRIQTELYFEGQYVSSRRVNEQIRSVFKASGYGIEVPTWLTITPDKILKTKEDWLKAYEELRASGLKKINESPLTQWIPSHFVKTGDQVTIAHNSCENYYIPYENASAGHLTYVSAFDWNTPQQITTTTVEGNASIVYSNKDHMYLASTIPMDTASLFDALPEGNDDAVEVVTEFTKLHKFTFSDSSLTIGYDASGYVPGVIEDQFALDEKDGYLRLTAEVRRSWMKKCNNGQVCYDYNMGFGFQQTNHLLVVNQEEQELVVVGDTGAIAPGEDIKSTRFIGNKGYLVTFRQTDPLFVIDLQSPTYPTVLGELAIPGFSEYMHPIDDNHLLTIGFDGDQWGANPTLALKIFDVTDPMHPTQSQYQQLNAFDSYALSQHKAFNYFAEKNLVTFPVSTYDDLGNGSYHWNNKLVLFRVSTETGFQDLGSVSHGSFIPSTDPNSGCYVDPVGTGINRGVFLDNFIYALSPIGITAHSLDNLSQPVSQLALPYSFNLYSYYGQPCTPTSPLTHLPYHVSNRSSRMRFLHQPSGNRILSFTKLRTKGGSSAKTPGFLCTVGWHHFCCTAGCPPTKENLLCHPTDFVVSQSYPLFGDSRW